MRAILDTNIFLSYLLARRQQGALVQVVEICLTDATIGVVLPQELVDELRETVAHKEYLQTQITLSRLEQFIEQLSAVAEIPAKLTSRSESDAGLAWR